MNKIIWKKGEDEMDYKTPIENAVKQMNEHQDTIIEALECISQEPNSVECDECAFGGEGHCPTVTIAEEALSLIFALKNTNNALEGLNRANRAEIERLKDKIKNMYKEMERIALMTVATDRKDKTSDDIGRYDPFTDSFINK